MKLAPGPVVSGREDGTSNVLTSLIGSVALLLCMVFAILGIKLKWFKHRLSFQQIPGSSMRGGNSSSLQNGEVVPLQGVFRRKEDADSFIEIERPKTLPPIRIRSTDVHIPVPHQQSQFAHASSNSKANNQPPTPPPMPTSSTTVQRSENRSQKSSRSQSSSRSKSSERSKKSDDQTTSSVKSNSSRKKKGHEESRSKTTSTPPAPPQYSEVNKKRREKDKDKTRPNTSFEPRAKPRNVPSGQHSDQTRHFEKLKDDRNVPKGEKGGRTIERRPTGFIRPNEEEMEALEKLSSIEDQQTFNLHGFSDNDEDNQAIFEKVKAKPAPEPRKRLSKEATSPTPPTPPVASVASKPSDTWSAVARHRILTEELTKQHSALKPVGLDMRSNGMSEFRNPLSTSPSAEAKPRTMRDMKKNKEIMSHNDRVVLGQEQRDDTEA